MIKYKEITSNLVGYIKSKLSLIIIMALAATLLSIVYQDRDIEITPDIMEEPILKPVPPKTKEANTETCTDTKSYIIETDSILKNGNFIALDLSTFELFKTKRIDSKRMGYYYRRNGAVREYYTVFKIEPKESDNKGFVELKK